MSIIYHHLYLLLLACFSTLFMNVIYTVFVYNKHNNRANSNCNNNDNNNDITDHFSHDILTQQIVLLFSFILLVSKFTEIH